MINKEIYNNDDKKIAFTISFMNDGDAGAWKEEFLRGIEDANRRADDITFGTWTAFRTALDDSSNRLMHRRRAIPNAQLEMGQDASIKRTHNQNSKFWFSQSGLGDSAD